MLLAEKNQNNQSINEKNIIKKVTLEMKEKKPIINDTYRNSAYHLTKDTYGRVYPWLDPLNETLYNIFHVLTSKGDIRSLLFENLTPYKEPLSKIIERLYWEKVDDFYPPEESEVFRNYFNEILQHEINRDIGVLNPKICYNILSTLNKKEDKKLVDIIEETYKDFKKLNERNPLNPANDLYLATVIAKFLNPDYVWRIHYNRIHNKTPLFETQDLEKILKMFNYTKQEVKSYIETKTNYTFKEIKEKLEPYLKDLTEDFAYTVGALNMKLEELMQNSLQKLNDFVNGNEFYQQLIITLNKKEYNSNLIFVPVKPENYEKYIKSFIAQTLETIGQITLETSPSTLSFLLNNLTPDYESGFSLYKHYLALLNANEHPHVPKDPYLNLRTGLWLNADIFYKKYLKTAFEVYLKMPDLIEEYLPPTVNPEFPYNLTAIKEMSKFLEALKITNPNNKTIEKYEILLAWEMRRQKISIMSAYNSTYLKNH